MRSPDRLDKHDLYQWHTKYIHEYEDIYIQTYLYMHTYHWNRQHRAQARHTTPNISCCFLVAKSLNPKKKDNHLLCIPSEWPVLTNFATHPFLTLTIIINRSHLPSQWSTPTSLGADPSQHTCPVFHTSYRNDWLALTSLGTDPSQHTFPTHPIMLTAHFRIFQIAKTGGCRKYTVEIWSMVTQACQAQNMSL